MPHTVYLKRALNNLLQHDAKLNIGNWITFYLKTHFIQNDLASNRCKNR